MIAVRVFNAHPRRRVRKAGIMRAIRRVAAGERCRAASVGVIFVDNRYCAKINWRYLRHRGGTDVLSFPMQERGAPDGEIYVNLDRARDQATAFGVTEANEITRLVVHGMLHLMGYDDGSARRRRSMKNREDAYVESLAPMRRRSKRT